MSNSPDFSLTDLMCAVRQFIDDPSPSNWESLWKVIAKIIEPLPHRGCVWSSTDECMRRISDISQERGFLRTLQDPKEKDPVRNLRLFANDVCTSKLKRAVICREGNEYSRLAFQIADQALRAQGLRELLDSGRDEAKGQFGVKVVKKIDYLRWASCAEAYLRRIATNCGFDTLRRMVRVREMPLSGERGGESDTPNTAKLVGGSDLSLRLEHRILVREVESLLEKHFSREQREWIRSFLEGPESLNRCARKYQVSQDTLRQRARRLLIRARELLGQESDQVPRAEKTRKS